MSIFYEKHIISENIDLSEEESRHCSQVLRHQAGDEITVFDGKGNKHHCILANVSKKKCTARIQHTESAPSRGYYFHLAIAPTKNMDRMEWLIEKLCELGADEITLIETAHSERRKIRMDRLEKKAIGAMKQSGNPFLPELNEITSLTAFLRKGFSGKKLIAHVDSNHQYLGNFIEKGDALTVLIGPEGDFSSKEVETAISAGYQPVSLGQTTLRTETAGLKACCFTCFINET